MVAALLAGAHSGEPVGFTAGPSKLTAVDRTGIRHTVVLEDGVIDGIEVRFLRWDKTVDNRVECLGHFELLPSSYLLPEPLADRDGDGVLEVAVLDADIGSGARTTRLRLLSPTPTRLVDALYTQHLDDHHWPKDLIDVDGDGVKDVVTLDLSLEGAFYDLAHALSPMVRSVFRFTPMGLVEDRTAPLLVAAREEHRVALASARDEGDTHAIVSHATAILLVDLHRGDAAAGHKAFDEAIRGLRLSPRVARDVARVRRDLARTLHAALPDDDLTTKR